MDYIWIIAIALVAYVAYHLYIKPMRIKAYYSKTFKDLGYKVFEYPYSFLAPPFLMDIIESQKIKMISAIQVSTFTAITTIWQFLMYLISLNSCFSMIN